ncbi:MAG: hypothetical protein ABEN55_23935 [Bradymonadaceae bacterium]
MLLALATGLAAIVGLSGCATAEAWEDDWGDDEVYAEWDEDDDDLLDQEEFTANVDWFEDYDEDDDLLGREEFETGPAEDFAAVDNFDDYDRDDDGDLTEDEFNAGLFEDFDEDDGDFLGEDEWGVESTVYRLPSTDDGRRFALAKRKSLAPQPDARRRIMGDIRSIADLRTLFAIVAAAIATLGVACEAGYQEQGAGEEEAAGVGWGDEETFNEWDEDGDAALTESEFNENAGWFSEYDEDGDGALNEEEFGQVSEDFENVEDFGTFDENGDAEISEDEFNTGLFETYDENDDNQLGEDEWG